MVSQLNTPSCWSRFECTHYRGTTWRIASNRFNFLLVFLSGTAEGELSGSGWMNLAAAVCVPKLWMASRRLSDFSLLQLPWKSSLFIWLAENPSKLAHEIYRSAEVFFYLMRPPNRTCAAPELVIDLLNRWFTDLNEIQIVAQPVQAADIERAFSTLSQDNISLTTLYRIRFSGWSAAAGAVLRPAAARTRCVPFYLIEILLDCFSIDAANSFSKTFRKTSNSFSVQI